MRKSLKSIPTSKFSRGVKIFKLTAQVGAQAVGTKLSTFFSSDEDKEKVGLLSKIKQAQKLTEVLSQMKGAAMKLGQILSLHGEHLFPKEVTDILSKLQQSSDELDYSEIEKVLKAEFGAKFSKIFSDFSEKPIASASIGQVHKACYKDEKLDVAVKVQYPGIESSIDSDVDALASLFSVLTALPSVRSFNEVTDEIKTILRLETDYKREGENVEFFRKYFANDPRIVVPRFIPKASTGHVLTTELIDGISVQDFSASSASTAVRSELGKVFLRVFYHELFKVRMVQTDPNFANYKVQMDPNGAKLVLLDFGAVKEYSEHFVTHYKKIIQVSLDDDYDKIRDEAVTLGFLREDDSKELVDLHYELVKMFMEPYQRDQIYSWHKNDLALRIRKFMPKFIFAFKLRPPPRDIIFLNRKIAGVYFFLSQIKAEFNPREILDEFLV